MREGARERGGERERANETEREREKISVFYTLDTDPISFLLYGILKINL